MTQTAATSAITGAGLVLGTVTMTSSATVPSGSVISQSPAAAANVAPGSSVNLTVSTGPAPTQVAVPNVVGMTQASATASITGVGLVVGTVTTTSSETVASGSVISESPAAATNVSPGSNVNLTISSGPSLVQVAVPNVVGLTQAAAMTAITAAGLIVGGFSSAPDSTVPYGTVAGQYPAAGTAVATGSGVNFTVSIGSPSVPAVVPNVVGLTQSAATTAITVAGVVVGTVTRASSSTVANGSVISESPPAATSVPPGTTVNLIVSSGGSATAGFAYVANGEGTISAYSRNSTTGALTALSPATITVIQSPPTPGVLDAIAIDPSGKFLYASGYYNNNGFVTGGIYAYVINTNGSLSVVPGSPFVTGGSPNAIVFDATGSYIYVSSINEDTVSGYALDPATGALTPVPHSPFNIAQVGQPTSMVRVGNGIYVANSPVNSIQIFTIIANTGGLNEGGVGAPFPASPDPGNLFVNPSGTVLFAMANASEMTEIFNLLAFNIDSSTSALTPFAANPLLTTSSYFATVDPSGQFLFLLNQTTGLEVYPINTLTGAIGTAVAGSPFATSANQSNAFPISVSFDSTGKIVYVVNGGSQSLSGGASSGGGIAEFTFDNTAGAINAVAGSPVKAGANPVGIAIK